MGRLRHRTRSVVLAGAAATLALTGACSSEASSGSGAERPAEGSAEKPATRVLQPGGPGEPAQEVEGQAEVSAEDSWNHADVMFAQMMIPHHAQALEMSRLARKRAEDPQVRTLAERIHAAQGPEIRLLADWLADRDLEVPRAHEDPSTHDHAKHGHAGMAGMLTEAEMDRLAASRGRSFDRLFLRRMIEHHRGALTMVNDITPDGEDLLISELSADMAASQAAEINRMQDVLASLPA